MVTFECGSGEPLVFIPGLQGRWEYMRPAVEALAETHRVITFPLCDEPSSGASFERERGLDSYVDHIRSIMDFAGIQRATICGVSFGGLIALRLAATLPQRTSTLVLVSTPGPQFHLKRRHKLYARIPWLFGPLFAAESPSRLRPELAMALPLESDRHAFTHQQLETFREAPLSPGRMARRALLIEQYDRAADCARVTCPTLIVHGEPALDFVVGADETASYGHLIAGARVVMIERTGHLGSLTKPREFAALVTGFLATARKDDRHSAA